MRPEAGGRRPEGGGISVLLVAAAALAAPGCLVDSNCVSDSDCTGNEICGADGACALECTAVDFSRCSEAEPLCLVAENRCVECLLPADCGDTEQCVNGSCVPGEAPDFELIDQNSQSPTYEQTVALSDFDGGVVLIFFAGLG